MRRRNIFLGYAVFYRGEHFECSRSPVARSKVYLKACALFKLNRISTAVFDRRRSDWKEHVERLWASDPYLTLRRVYAEGDRK